MSERTYYVICEDNCRFESMTKEQILAAIEQAVSTGEIKDVDAGFVTKLKEMNHGTGLSFWVGTTAEYNAITTKTENCFYILTDDDTESGIEQAIEALQASVSSLSTTVSGLDSSVDQLQENVFALQTFPNKRLLYNTDGITQSTDIDCPAAVNYSLFAVRCEADTWSLATLMYADKRYNDDTAGNTYHMKSFVTRPLSIDSTGAVTKSLTIQLFVNGTNLKVTAAGTEENVKVTEIIGVL